MTLRRLLGLFAAVSGRLRRGISTSASRPPWAMVYLHPKLNTPAPRVSLQLAKPPCISRLIVPAHLVHQRPGPDPNTGDISLGFGGFVKASSGDGLLLNFLDLRGTAPVVSTHGGTQGRRLIGVSLEPNVTGFVCNPLTGQLFCLPDIDGKKKTLTCAGLGILTQSERPHRPPDRFVVAELSAPDDDAEDQSFFLRRFLSQTGEWDKKVRLTSPLPLVRRMDIDREVLAFAGRLWYVDVSWGAVSVDPFSDRPDLRFIELPRGSVTEPPKGPLEPDLDGYRRMGVSEGRLRYAEVSQEEPFVLSSYALDAVDGNGSCWTLEHRVALRRLLPHEDLLSEENTPRIGVVDPMNASVMHITVGNQTFSVDMDKEMVLACSLTGPSLKFGFLKSCVLPPWLESSRIPSAGTLSSNKASIKSKTLSDILVRVDMHTKN